MKAEQNINVTAEVQEFFNRELDKPAIGTLPGLYFETQGRPILASRRVSEIDCYRHYEWTERNQIQEGKVNMLETWPGRGPDIGTIETSNGGRINLTRGMLEQLIFRAPRMETTKAESDLKDRIKEKAPFLHKKPAELLQESEHNNMTVSSSDPLLDPVMYGYSFRGENSGSRKILLNTRLVDLSVYRNKSRNLSALVAMQEKYYGIKEIGNVALDRLKFESKEKPKPIGINKVLALIYEISRGAGGETMTTQQINDLLKEINKEIKNNLKNINLRSAEDNSGESRLTIAGKYKRGKVEDISLMKYRIYDKFPFDKIIFDEETKALFAIDTKTAEARDLHNKIIDDSIF